MYNLCQRFFSKGGHEYSCCINSWEKETISMWGFWLQLFSKEQHEKPCWPIDHFGTEHFGTDVSSREHFGTCTVRHCGRSGRWIFNTGTFRHGEFSAWGIFVTRNFRHLNISAQGYFGIWTFQHMDILAPCKAIWTFRHRHFGTSATVKKWPCAKMSPCRNVPVMKNPCAEKSLCRKFPMLKCSCVEKTICRNIRSDE